MAFLENLRQLNGQQRIEQEQAKEVESLVSVLRKLQVECVYCHMHHSRAATMHHITTCNYGGTVYFTECIAWKKPPMLRLPKGCCYACGNPQWICSGTTPEMCEYRDTTLLICYLALQFPALVKKVGGSLNLEVPVEAPRLRSWIPLPETCFKNRLGHKGLRFAHGVLNELGLC